MSINKKTFCVAPWYGIFLDSDKRLSPCCKFKGGLHHYKDIKNYFHSDELNRVRKDLLNGVKNESCAKCWKDEELGGDSLRLISNRTIVKETNTRLMDQIEKPSLNNLVSFDLTLGNLCNLKCVMCNPSRSSQLLAEVNSNTNLRSLYNEKYQQKNYDWPKDIDFIKWCDRYLPQAIHISFTGGEPFIIPWIHSVVDRIPDEQKKRCVLHFTTNLTSINYKLFDCFSKFKQVWISISVEGIHDTYEYLRYGHLWNNLSQNIQKVQQMQIENLILKINYVVQAPSYHSVIDMTNYFDERMLPIHPILLTSPKHFSIRALTENCKKSFLEQTSNYAGYNKKFIDFVRSSTELNLKQDKVLAKKLSRHLEQFDKVRKNDHKKIIPGSNLH
jgi:molybdenum cofactor biosynthesis enzyme MoaA